MHEQLPDVIAEKPDEPENKLTPSETEERDAKFLRWLGSERDHWFTRATELEADKNVLIGQLRASRQHVADLTTQRDRVTDLFEKWAAEESEHRKDGVYGLAEGLHIAIEELREAVHGKGNPNA
jgi:hypothetical protein